jgi:hypothetical protein
MYRKEFRNRLLIDFPGLSEIERNYSQAYQDIFVLSMLNGKVEGTFLEIGAFDPFELSNTYLLEKQFGWAGLSIDIDPKVEKKFRKHRKCDYLTADAVTLDYCSVLPRFFPSKRIDYLQIDIEPRKQSLAALKAIPLNDFRFNVVTFETDFYSSEGGKKEALLIRNESRKIFRENGYLLVGDGIAVNGSEDVFEDWYVDTSTIPLARYSILDYERPFNDSGQRFLTANPHVVATEFLDGQGLGNQLWTYAVTRVIAKKRGIKFAILNTNRFKGQDFIGIDYGISSKSDSFLIESYSKDYSATLNNYRVERKVYDKSGRYDISTADPNILNCPVDCRIDGNFQSYEYIKHNAEEIPSWFKIDELPDKILELIDKSCVIHIRGGDFKNIIPKPYLVSYYSNAIRYMRETIGVLDFKCVTDDLSFAQSVLPAGIEYIGSCNVGTRDSLQANHHMGGPIDLDFKIMLNALNLIIPPSSFAWWASFLNSKKRNVIAPKYWAAHTSSTGLWSTFEIATPGFTYLDKDGNFFSYKQCVSERELLKSTLSFYPRFSLRAKLRNNPKVRHMYSQLLKFFGVTKMRGF